MPLEPKYEYSIKVLTEIICSIGAKLVEFAGETKAKELLPQIMRPVGERDAKKLMMLTGIKNENATSAAILTYAAGSILGMDLTIAKMDPHLSQIRFNKCPYGDAIERYKSPVICYACVGYNTGFTEPLSVKLVRDERVRASGRIYCFASFLCMDPKSEDIPSTVRTELVTKVASMLPTKNDFVISTLVPFIFGLEEKCNLAIGQKNALTAAKNTFSAGAYQGPIFAGEAGLKGDRTDAAKLVSEVRETLNCRTTLYHTNEGFIISTKNCPLKAKCTGRGFIEAACVGYTRGLLSKYGNYDIRTDTTGPACRQEFMQTAPQTEKKA